MKNKIICLNQLSLKLSEQEILENIDLELAVGEIVVVIGPNGAGKSSLIETMLGLHSPTTGEISINHNYLGKEFSFGFVPASFSLASNSPITIEELLKMTLVNCRHSNKEKEQLITQALKNVGLHNYETKRYLDLSMGQKKRVLLSRAIVHQPQIIFMDEPETNLDYLAVKNLYQLIGKLAKKQQMSVVIASHNFSEIAKIADKIVGLNKKIFFQGSSKLLANQEKLIELYQA
ncbi:MAG: metal ABC transporter ATP-binding protein [Patescibacteria group bacterium]